MGTFTIKPLEWEIRIQNGGYALHVPVNCAVNISIEAYADGRCKAKSLHSGEGALEAAKAEVEALHHEALSLFLSPAVAPDDPIGVDWAIKRCKALQNQGFDRILLHVFQKDMENALAAARDMTARDGAQA
jgi:hypothetical protein